MGEVRIATVKADGRRYLVQRLDLTPGQPAAVMCWGEVVSFRGRASKHGPSKRFLREAVDLGEVEKTSALLKALAIQGALVEGRSVRETARGNLIIGPSAAEVEDSRRQAEALRPLVKAFGEIAAVKRALGADREPTPRERTVARLANELMQKIAEGK